MTSITKRISDYFIPKVLYENTSEYNRDIKVIEVLNTRKMIVNEFVQSYGYPSKFAKKRIWGQIALNMYKNKPDAKNLLLLGMGAGTTLHYIKEIFENKQPEITSVEIDKKIVDIARKYFNLDEIKRHKIIINNAYEVLENPKKYNINTKFDCIIVDTYLGNKRIGLINKNFVKNIQNLLTKDGLLIFNVVIPKKEIKQVDLYMKAFQKLGLNLKIQKVKSYGKSDNYLYYGSDIFPKYKEE